MNSWPSSLHSSVHPLKVGLTEDCRQLLYLDFFRFFGTMIIVLKEMLKESAVFFLLLLVIVAGFVQSFFG
jgi:hypothetical protein